MNLSVQIDNAGLWISPFRLCDPPETTHFFFWCVRAVPRCLRVLTSSSAFLPSSLWREGSFTAHTQQRKSIRNPHLQPCGVKVEGIHCNIWGPVLHDTQLTTPIRQRMLLWCFMLNCRPNYCRIVPFIACMCFTATDFSQQLHLCTNNTPT